jgi:hypothetical protein
MNGAGGDGTTAACREPGRHHLAAVADAFLPFASPRQRERPDALTVYAAAPGDLDTAGILATLLLAHPSRSCHDLGGLVGLRVGRWERGGQLGDTNSGRSLLLWCPVGPEGLALTSALTLGRLAALLCPRKLTVLWFAAGVEAPGRRPDNRQRLRVKALAVAAVPQAEVALHCLGWLAESRRELEDLARRFG